MGWYTPVVAPRCVCLYTKAQGEAQLLAERVFDEYMPAKAFSVFSAKSRSEGVLKARTQAFGKLLLRLICITDFDLARSVRRPPPRTVSNCVTRGRIRATLIHDICLSLLPSFSPPPRVSWLLLWLLDPDHLLDVHYVDV